MSEHTIKYSSTSYKPNYNDWSRLFFKAWICMARFYDPKNDQTKKAAKCFFESSFYILPDNNMKKLFLEFIIGKHNDKLRNIPELQSFFNLKRNINLQWDSWFETNESLINMLYLLSQYWNLISGLNIIPWREFNSTYNKNSIDKTCWARPTWFMIHTIAICAPDIIPFEWGQKYKDMIWCLQWMLPCSICKEHLAENLGAFPIDNFLSSRKALFSWTWRLHNIVNKQTGSPLITLQEAETIYQPI